METRALFRSKWIFLAGVVLLLPLLAGCQEEGLPDEEGAEVSLSRVPDNPGFASFPLIGTQWKLIGFVDGKSNRIKLAEPVTESNFSILFAESGTFEGYASVNLVYGKCNYHSSFELTISEFNLSTKAGEFPDGWLYIDAMSSVSSYRFSSKGLALYYGTQKYLLFEPQ